MATNQYTGPLTPYIQASIDQFREWVAVPTFLQFLRTLEQYLFHLQTGKTAVTDVLASLQPAQPYSIKDGQATLVDLRFGTTTNAAAADPTRSFIALFSDGWADWLTNVRLAADTAQRPMTLAAANPNIPATEAPDANSMRQQANDAVVAIRRQIGFARTKLSACVGVYTVQTFESKYSLLWGTSTMPIPPADGLAVSHKTKSEFDALNESLKKLVSVLAVQGAEIPPLSS